MIDDQELSALFQAESEEHLQGLDEALLRLEQEPADATALDQAYRTAHSLKGTARMMGVTDVEAIAHHFEDALGKACKGVRALTGETVEPLYGGLDAMRKLVRQAVDGVDAGVDLTAVLTNLKNPSAAASPVRPAAAQPVAPALESEPPAAPKQERATTVLVESPEATATVEASSQALAESPGAAFKIQTMRVEPQKLDALLMLAGELTVTTNRVARGVVDFQDLVRMSEDWNRDVTSHTRSRGRSATEPERLAALVSLLERLQRSTYEEVNRLSFVAAELGEAITRIRLLPVSTVFNLFPRMVRDLAMLQGKEVNLVLDGGETNVDKRILEELKDPLMHIVRNSVDHGIEAPEQRRQSGKPPTATLLIRAYQTAISVVVEVSDDGRGLDLESIKRTALKRRLCHEDELAGMPQEQVEALIFAPGFSTATLITDLSGRGVGLDVVRNNVESLKGTVHVSSVAGAGCLFTLRMPISLATTRVLLVGVAGMRYALPAQYVESAVTVERDKIFTIEGRPAVLLDGQAVSLARLLDLLELPGAGGVTDASRMQSGPLWCIVLRVGNERIGLVVDALIDEQEVVLKPLGFMLKRVRNVSGATILGTGDICMVLNAADLLRSVQKVDRPLMLPSDEAAKAPAKKVILLAEDSITTRTQEKRILEGAGYEVVTAVDGADAYGKIGSRHFDALVTDVQMPNLDGLELTARIREDKRFHELPIILVTSLMSDDDRRRGVEAGANAYVTKGGFDQKVLLDALGRLV